MRNSRLLSTGVLVGVLAGAVSVTVTAQQDPGLQIENYQGVSYISGGVGEGEIDYLKTIARDFNLRLMFATQEGKFLADIQVQIRDAKGATVLETVANGPFLYADLMPGTYRVWVSDSSQNFQQAVKVTRGKQARLNFYWK